MYKRHFFEYNERFRTFSYASFSRRFNYVFSINKKFINHFINNFSFGGCVINDTLIHYINSNLPFGGIGNSGMGAYRGKHSFDTFSHYKPVLKKQSFFLDNLRFGPHPESFNTLKKLLRKF